MTILTVLVVWSVLYFVVLRFMNIGVKRVPKSVRLPDERCVPVTVLVSARNEERDLPHCIDSLLALDYPADKLQIVLVNDLSTDRTAAIIDRAASQHAHIVALHTGERPDNGLEAKARGIALGFTAATGEWVLITDADGTVRPEWIRHLLGYADAKTGIVGGALVVRPEGLLGKVERMAWAFLQTFNFGMTGWGAPIVSVGPNMGIRRALYQQAGGLENAQNFRIAEDLAMFLMAKSRGMRAHLYMDHATAVTISPVPSFGHLLSQHRRWLYGGIEQSRAYQIPLVLAMTWGVGLVAFIATGWLLDWKVWAAFLALKTTHDGLMLRLQGRRLGERHHVRFLPILELYQIVAITLVSASFLFSRRIEWKGDGYAVRYK
ncbi:MAG: glycosyltransferase [Gemmatimonas sp.]